MKLPSSPASLVIRGFLAAFALIAPLSAQSVTFGSVSETPTNFSGSTGQYHATIAGTLYQNISFPAFNVTVASGSGIGATLIGQNFLAVCVNVTLPGLVGVDSEDQFVLSTDGSSLSYNISGTDYWDVNRAAKFSAVRDVVTSFTSGLSGADSEQYQYMITALNFALAEITMDGGADVDPLGTGNAIFTLSDGSEVTGDVLNYFNTYIAAVGTVDSSATTIYAAGFGSDIFQDVILIPIPEPSAALLAGLAGVAGLVRRRRIA